MKYQVTTPAPRSRRHVVEACSFHVMPDGALVFLGESVDRVETFGPRGTVAAFCSGSWESVLPKETAGEADA